jgi:hypothetical protein
MRRFALVSVWRTVVKVPTATILLPIWVIPFTEPFITCGVKSAGFVATTDDCAVLTAVAGAATPVRAIAIPPAVSRVSRRRWTGMRITEPPPAMPGAQTSGPPPLTSTTTLIPRCRAEHKNRNVGRSASQNRQNGLPVTLWPSPFTRW